LDPSPEAMEGDSYEDDEDEYNADSPEHEKKLLHKAKGSNVGH